MILYPQQQESQTRHNPLLSSTSYLLHQRFVVQKELHYRTQKGLRKSAVVATISSLSLMIDTQIVGGQGDLKRARTVKIRMYADNLDMEFIGQNRQFSNKLTHIISSTCRASSPGGESGANHWHQIDLLNHWHQISLIINRTYLAAITTWVIIIGIIAQELRSTAVTSR